MWNLRSMPCSVSIIQLEVANDADSLLGMSDPDAARQDSPPPPPQPPRRSQNAAQSQLEADEAYARRLAEQYNGVSYSGRHREESGWGSREPRLPRQRKETGLKPNELYDDRERSFMDGTYTP